VVNLIPGEHAWHVSVSPDGAELLRGESALRIGG
jgi:hypothetical protein